MEMAVRNLIGKSLWIYMKLLSLCHSASFFLCFHVFVYQETKMIIKFALNILQSSPLQVHFQLNLDKYSKGYSNMGKSGITQSNAYGNSRNRLSIPIIDLTIVNNSFLWIRFMRIFHKIHIFTVATTFDRECKQFKIKMKIIMNVLQNWCLNILPVKPKEGGLKVLKIEINFLNEPVQTKRCQIQQCSHC
jgi:hypothetical protein